jgi:hypothetical protein
VCCCLQCPPPLQPSGSAFQGKWACPIICIQKSGSSCWMTHASGCGPSSGM